MLDWWRARRYAKLRHFQYEGKIRNLVHVFCQTPLCLAKDKNGVMYRYCWRCDWLEKLPKSVTTPALIFDKETEQKIKRIAKECNTDEKDVMRLAMWLLDLYIKEEALGRKVYITAKDGELINEITLSDVKKYVPDKGWVFDLSGDDEEERPN